MGIEERPAKTDGLTFHESVLPFLTRFGEKLIVQSRWADPEIETAEVTERLKRLYIITCMDME